MIDRPFFLSVECRSTRLVVVYECGLAETDVGRVCVSRLKQAAGENLKKEIVVLERVT